MEDEFGVFEAFYRNVYLIARRAAAYYGLTEEELKQESAIVYFESPSIAEAYSSGNNKLALSMFMSGMRKSLVDFSPSGMQIDRNTGYQRDKAYVERMEVNYEEEQDVETVIMNKLELDTFRCLFGKEEIDDIIEYYELGSNEYARKHNIPSSTARKAIKRRVEKIKNQYI